MTAEARLFMANRAPTLDPYVFCIRDLMREGSNRLPPEYRDYFNGGAMDMITLRENEEAFNRYKIRPRILRNVSDIDLSTEFLGRKAAFPCGFSPSAMHKLAHTDGELATSRAAARLGIPMAVSSYSTSSLEDVEAQGKGNPYVIQMCILKDRNITLQLLRRAESKDLLPSWFRDLVPQNSPTATAQR